MWSRIDILSLCKWFRFTHMWNKIKCFTPQQGVRMSAEQYSLAKMMSSGWPKESVGYKELCIHMDSWPSLWLELRINKVKWQKSFLCVFGPTSIYMHIYTYTYTYTYIYICMFTLAKVIIHILMPYNIIIYFRLLHFNVSNSALFPTQYFSTLILHRGSLDTFCMDYSYTG